MKGILIVAHASREASAIEVFHTVVELVRARVGMPVESACTGLPGENIEAGLETLVKRGVTEIKVIPYFLFNGTHIQKGLPEEIRQFQQKHAEIAIAIGKGLGADPRLADILVDRILEPI